MAQALLDHFAEPLVRKCIALALQGDLKALQLCFDRILPTRRQPSVDIGYYSMETPADLSKASEVVTQKVATGRLTPEQGHSLSELFEKRRKVIETQVFDQRLRKLEEKQV